jgi:hypothetical protein
MPRPPFSFWRNIRERCLNVIAVLSVMRGDCALVNALSSTAFLRKICLQKLHAR